MEKENISMKVVNPSAAGIDVGSRSHWVAVGQSEKEVKEFGAYNEDLFELSDWLTSHNIRTVAMESTGTYWQNLYAVLISHGFHVIPCNGKFTKNIKGKKSDDSKYAIPLFPHLAKNYLLINPTYEAFGSTVI